MAYIMEVCRAGVTIEVIKKHSRRYPPPGSRREKKKKPTPEAQEAVNARNAETRIRRDMNHNFRPGDLYITLDYARENRPEDGSEMREHVTGSNGICGDCTRKRGWISNICMSWNGGIAGRCIIIS